MVAYNQLGGKFNVVSYNYDAYSPTGSHGESATIQVLEQR
jgi:hypothetical protein